MIPWTPDFPSGAPGGSARESSSGMASTPATPSISSWPPIARTDLGTAIDALAQIPRPAHLVAVGDDTHIAHIGSPAQARGIGDRVTLVGNAGDLRPYYGAGDVFGAARLRTVPGCSTRSPGPRRASDREHEGGRRRAPCASTIAGSSAVWCDVAALCWRHAGAAGPANACGIRGRRRGAALPLSPTAMTLQQGLLYRDLLATAPCDDTRAAALARAGVAR